MSELTPVSYSTLTRPKIKFRFEKIAVIGLGHAGISLGAGLAEAFEFVTGFDLSRRRVSTLMGGSDASGEGDDGRLAFTFKISRDPEDMANATVYIVGEAKTPDALRNASDQFFEWTRPEKPDKPAPPKAPAKTGGHQKPDETEPEPPATSSPIIKRRPRFVAEAVALLTSDTAEGKVTLSALGQYLKRTDPAFSPQTYGHSGLLNMVKTYDLLSAREAGGQWWVSLQAGPEASPQKD